mmetsp:Transcript_31118/g.66043  ORF Transcript_31118/g.66043 Transcript_31118/m.66043 type:complete len:96 (-) Transcript_31118:1530-1817(-)
MDAAKLYRQTVENGLSDGLAKGHCQIKPSPPPDRTLAGTGGGFFEEEACADCSKAVTAALAPPGRSRSVGPARVGGGAGGEVGSGGGGKVCNSSN